MKSLLSFLWEVTKITIIALAIILPIRYFLVQPFFVKGASMEPSFQDGQYLIIDELSYRLREPQRGEVIIFRYPPDPKQFYIKRLIGLPGETVEINDSRVKIYNQKNPAGFVLDESSYLAESVSTYGDAKIVLNEDEYFVLGDNRESSFDSRRWGILPEDNIIGRALLRAWPPQDAVWLATPQYSF